MMVENELELTYSTVQCQTCSGRGKTEIFREDLEEFEEVTCICQVTN